METVVILTVPEVPPSFNAVGGGTGSRWAWVKLKKQWEQILGMEMMVHRQRIPKDVTSVLVSGDIRFKQKRRRDMVNYRTILDKVAGDFLQKMSLIPDDTAEMFNFGTLTLSVDPNQPQRTELRFTFTSPDPA